MKTSLKIIGLPIPVELEQLPIGTWFQQRQNLHIRIPFHSYLEYDSTKNFDDGFLPILCVEDGVIMMLDRGELVYPLNIDITVVSYVNIHE